MLKYEQQLRSSDSIQSEYSKADGDPYQLESITENLQREVVNKFMDQMIHESNGHLKEDYALLAFRNCRQIYKDDPEVNQLTYYFKYDRTKFGLVQLNQKAPVTGFSLFDLNKNSFSLSDYLAQHETVVIFSGSYTYVYI